MNQSTTNLTRNASAAILFPIAGLLGGFLMGALRVSGTRMGEIDRIGCVVRWGTVGFFLGLFLIVLLSLNPRGKNIISIRRLMAFVLVAGLLSWYITRIFFGVIGLEGF